jgi:hypothetical protein
MKNKLLPLLFLVGSFGAYSQIGIGTKIPNTSSALDVYGSDKGLLIPRVSLTGTTDATTIANGNVESLLVYNKATVSDITPGYYYWFNAKWNRITIAGEQVPGLNGLEGGPGIPGVNGVTPANGTV